MGKHFTDRPFPRKEEELKSTLPNSLYTKLHQRLVFSHMLVAYDVKGILFETAVETFIYGDLIPEVDSSSASNILHFEKFSHTCW